MVLWFLFGAVTIRVSCTVLPLHLLVITALWYQVHSDTQFTQMPFSASDCSINPLSLLENKLGSRNLQTPENGHPQIYDHLHVRGEQTARWWMGCPTDAGSADSDASYVIASQGEMADAMGFSVRWAQRPLQAHSILWWRWLSGSW
jgi:hypothetical protein